jgi:DNA-binding transcriptional MerR regulator
MENKGEYFIPINEVAKRLGVPAHTLRYWEKQFPGAIRPVTGAGNRRYYRQDTVDKIDMIKSLLYDKGMTIAGVKKILHNGTFDDEAKIAKIPVSVQSSQSIINTGKNESKTSVNTDDIDVAIKLLNQAKMFLD